MLQIDDAPELNAVKIITPHVRVDGRGFFFESFRQSWFESLGISDHFCQDNHSLSAQGTLRGLHYQLAPQCQSKLVRCIRGEIFDVAVDIRKDSPTFGKWVGQMLSDQNKKMLYVPSDFAHGFYVLSEMAEVVYKCSDYYSPEHEQTIRYDDPLFCITWPFLSDIPVQLSERDRLSGFFK